MRETAKPAPRDPRHEPIRDPARRGTGRWLGAGALVLLALVVILWLTALPDVADRTDVAPSTAVPAEAVIADPNPVVPQDAPIQPAPVREEPSQ